MAKKTIKTEKAEKPAKKEPGLMELNTFVQSSGNQNIKGRLQVEADVAGIKTASYQDWEKLLKKSLSREG